MGMVHWPSDPKIQIKKIFSLTKGDAANVSLITMGSHTGTHMDAPSHFLKKGQSIDQMPLDATIGKARVIEIYDPVSVKPDELKKYRIRPGERILFKTINSSRLWKKNSFVKNFVYISKEAAQFLAQCKIKSVGVDYLSVGGYQKEGALTHQILLKAGIWIIEGLNLSRVQPGKYELICLPLKLVNGDGAPARAVLIKERH
ncbi:MAG: cyclase family protein [Chlamydiae bacterium]|nr:cyclase family protein [Chlamydiota bacterium]